MAKFRRFKLFKLIFSWTDQIVLLFSKQKCWLSGQTKLRWYSNIKDCCSQWKVLRFKYTFSKVKATTEMHEYCMRFPTIRQYLPLNGQSYEICKLFLLCTENCMELKLICIIVITLQKQTTKHTIRFLQSKSSSIW